jgi:hypothetical protein
VAAVPSGPNWTPPPTIKIKKKTNHFQILLYLWLFHYWLQNSCLYILVQSKLTSSKIVKHDAKFTNQSITDDVLHIHFRSNFIVKS